MRIGENIRKWRSLKGLKQKELARALQLSEAAISNIENDVTNISLDQMQEISRVIDITVEQLFLDPSKLMISLLQTVECLKSELKTKNQQIQHLIHNK